MIFQKTFRNQNQSLIRNPFILQSAITIPQSSKSTIKMAYYPPVGFHFKVEFQGLSGATSNDVRFQEVGGLTMELGIEEIQEGGNNGFVHRLPNKPKFGNLILKRGMLKDSGLVNWFKNAIEDFSFEPITVTVSLLNENHEPLQGWSFEKAWPVKWVVSDFKASDNSVVVETIELAYNRFRRIS